MNKAIKIADRLIGDGYPTFVVAEIGLNHNGSLSLAKRLALAAKRAGCDAVKFQKRDLKALYKSDIYKDPNRDSQATAYLFDIFKRFELSKHDFIELNKYCQKLDVIFFCTPFDLPSSDFLETIDVPLYKIASADLTNIPLIEHITKKKKPIILSTGMSSLSEIDQAAAILKKAKAKFALLHCVSTYPVAFKDVNLNMIPILKKRYRVPVGYSGHERGILVAVCAAAFGANIIERHFTLDRSMEGPDHNISLMPEGMFKMIERIRVAEVVGGTGSKQLTRGEILTREVFAKSIVAAININKGQTIRRSMIAIKSPGKGLSPLYIDELIGIKAKRNIKKDEYFTQSDL